MAFLLTRRDREILEGKEIPESFTSLLFSDETDYDQSPQHNLQTEVPPPPPSTHFTLDLIRKAVEQEKERLFKKDVNQLLRSQEEHLQKKVLARTRTQHHSLMIWAKELVIKGLQEKDGEVRRAVHRVRQLQNLLAQVKIEARAWRVKLAGQQNAIESLRDQLREVNAAGANEHEGSGDSEDAESASCFGNTSNDDSLKGICRECEDRAASVLLLPCRHLCLCVKCNEEVDPVPCHICRSFRSGYVQVLLD